MTAPEALAMVEAAARGGGADLEEPLRRAMLHVVHQCKTACALVVKMSTNEITEASMNATLRNAVLTLSRVEAYLIKAERKASERKASEGRDGAAFVVLAALAPLALLVLHPQNHARLAYERAMRELVEANTD